MASLLNRSFENHFTELTATFKESLKCQSPDVQKAFYRNFIQPLNGGYEPVDLPGKYKPSWVAEFADSPMLAAILAACIKYQAHHYHFGFEFYLDGKDPEFSGQVSSGIVHTKLSSIGNDLVHTVFAVHTKHPKPFYCPIHLLNKSP